MEIKEWVQDEIRRLQENGFWFWSGKVLPTALGHAGIKTLKATRQQFLDILSTSSPEELIANVLHPPAPLTPFLAIKHAMIASDVGAELLDRAKDYIAFRKIQRLHIHLKDGSQKNYDLKCLGEKFTRRLSNNVIAKGNLELLSDIAVIIFFGCQLEEFKRFPSFKRCCLGLLVGDPQALSNYFSDLLLNVSRQVTGMYTAASGGPPQELVRKHIEQRFAKSLIIRLRPDRRVPNFAVGRKRQFDLVVEIQTPKDLVYVAIEVAFQETTNSVIERKAREAVTVFKALKAEGNFLCYVVDGAGYFARRKALIDIIENSHRRSTFKESELDALCDFIQEIAEGRFA